MTPEFQQKVDDFSQIGDQVCQSLADYLSAMGMDCQSLPRIETTGLVYSEQRDPYSGEVSLQGEWHDNHGVLCGSLSYRENGSLYIEHDILQPHPTDQRWIIEAITAWGLPSELNIEPKLMPALGD